MSDFLAEARVVVRPDTSAFRAELLAQLKTVTSTPIRIPVVPVAAVGLASLTAETAALTSVQSQAVVTTQELAAAQEKEAVTAARATAAQTAHVRSISQITRGAAASGLTLFGLRGATLAASGAFLAGTAAVVAFSKSVQSAADLETELNVFRVTAGATADEMDRVSESAKQLGRDITLPGITAGSAATAMTELAKAGLSVRDSMDAARGVLQLATAAQIDVKDSTELVAGALNAFSLNGEDAIKVADLLAGAAKESQGEITDMGTALAQAAAVSNQFGVSIEDTVTLLTELAQAGIAGGRAGTSLRVAFLRLVNPPADAAKALKELNVQIRDANGNLRPQIFTDIANAMAGYTKAQQDATLATIFGSDAIRTAAIIGTKGATAFSLTKDAVTEAGLAQEQAAARTQGLAGEVENLSNQASGLGLTIGNLAKGPLSSLTRYLADTVGQANDAVEQIVGLAESFKDMADAAGESLGPLDELIGSLDKLSPGSLTRDLPDTVEEASLWFRLLNERAEDFTRIDFVKNQTLKQAKKDVQELIAELNKSGGSAIKFDEVVSSLIDMQKQMAGGSAEARQFAENIGPLIANLQDLSQQPEVTLPIELPPGLVDGSAGKDAAKATSKEFRDYMLQADFGINAFVKAFGDAGKEAGKAFTVGLSGVVTSGIQAAKAGAGKQAGLSDLLNQILIGGGGPQEQLANLERQADNQRQIIAKAVEGLSTLTSSDKGYATLIKAAREGRATLVGILNAQERIRDQITSDTKKAADDAAQAVRDREQNLLAEQALARDQQQNLIAAAQLTPGLKDDLNRQKGLAQLVRDQIKAVRDQISAEGGKKAALVALDAILKQVGAALAKIREQQKQNQEQNRKNAQENISLDVELAQITGNQAAEVNARERLIKNLKAQQALVKEGTNEYKRLRNQIAQETAAINEIRKEKEKQNQSFAQASFEFLQAQSGFASTLLGNLIPRGATGGLVGGGAPVQTALQPAVGAAEARSQSGVTSGQGNATNHILQQILWQLQELNGETKAPEARKQRAHSWSLMDGVGGG